MVEPWATSACICAYFSSRYCSTDALSNRTRDMIAEKRGDGVGCDSVVASLAPRRAENIRVPRAGTARRREPDLFGFGLATRTKPPRSTGRRTTVFTRLLDPGHKPRPRKRISRLFRVVLRRHAFQCPFTLAVTRAPVRIGGSVPTNIRLGVTTFPAEGGVSPTVYNPLLIRPQIRRRMTRKRTRLIPMSTALAAVAVHLCMLGRSERPAFHLHLLRRECRSIYFLFCLSVE